MLGSHPYLQFNYLAHTYDLFIGGVFVSIPNIGETAHYQRVLDELQLPKSDKEDCQGLSFALDVTADKCT